MVEAGSADKRAEWWWILLLWAPVGFFYLAHFAAALLHPDLLPTGFVLYDLPYAMACAREFADEDLFGPLFTLPSDLGPGQPVLLQLHVWALGTIWRLFPVDPGAIYVVFGMVMGLLAVRAFIRFFDRIVPLSGPARRTGHFLFLWGGGLLALSGEALNIVHGRPLADTWKHLLDLDPAYGWWMMNLGRCLVIPNEAYYHLLYFTIAAGFLEKRYWTAVILLGFLAASHPFAGTGGLVVFGAWAMLERWAVRDAHMPLGVPLAIAAIFLSCCAYYFLWLPPRMDPHLTSAMPLSYVVEARSTFAAYVLVLLMVLARLRSLGRVDDFLRTSTGRLLAVMGVAHLLLENHELFIPPFQPAHFTRGYSWAALFLIGAPWLMNEAWPLLRQRAPRWATVVAFIAVIVSVSDNTVFFALGMKRELRASPPGFWLDRSQREVLGFLRTLPAHGPLVIAQDEVLGYMVIVYTPHRAYRSHFFDEADAWSRVKDQAAFFDGHITDPLLAGPLIVVASRDSGDFVPPGLSNVLFENDGYRVLVSGRPVGPP